MQTVHDLETPSVLIDLDVVERNIARLQTKCDELGVQFRPHIKTHKIPTLAEMQLAAGANGIACQKVTEAAVFVDAGITDIQIPYNIVGEKKTARLAELTKRAKVTVTVDSIPVIDGIAQAAKNAGVTIHVLVELVGDNHRTGIIHTNVVELAQHVITQDALQFDGVMIYPSNAAVRPRLQEALQMLNDAGIDVDIISGGGFGASHELEQMPELTELRVGTYIFSDYGSVQRGWSSLEDCAMKIRATVVSANEQDRVIIDGGTKTINAERVDNLLGYIVEYPEARLYNANEEHGFIDFSAYDTMPQVGDVVHVIPVHTCVVTNLHNALYGVRGDNIEQEYAVAARGLVW